MQASQNTRPDGMADGLVGGDRLHKGQAPGVSSQGALGSAGYMLTGARGRGFSIN